jgi:hypothetical protein
MQKLFPQNQLDFRSKKYTILRIPQMLSMENTESSSVDISEVPATLLTNHAFTRAYLVAAGAIARLQCIENSSQNLYTIPVYQSTPL